MITLNVPDKFLNLQGFYAESCLGDPGERAGMKIDQILRIAIRGGASDIIVKVGALPRFRLSNKLISLADGSVVTPEMMNDWLKALIPAKMRAQLEEIRDLDFAYQSPDGYRFRVNIFRQRQLFGMVLRVINNTVRSLEELQLPPILTQLAEESRGLVLVTGATGSGKSTTLAAMMERINTHQAKHIITIEDPIEYTYQEKKSTINQREVGIDTESFPQALRSALRQNPDVILVGELRDSETVETALKAAETGHMVYSTLHTQDAQETITRIMSFFTPHQHEQIRLSLAGSLKAIISQRLLSRVDGKGMVPALEIMITNERIRDLILKGNTKIITDVIEKSKDFYGMQTFDQSVLELLERGVISENEALRAATNKKDFELKLQGVA